jgi:hypothetical protein
VKKPDDLENIDITDGTAIYQLCDRFVEEPLEKSSLFKISRNSKPGIHETTVAMCVRRKVARFSWA